MGLRNGTLVMRTSVMVLGLLCYIMVLHSQPPQQLALDVGDSDPSDQSVASNQADDQSEASISPADQQEARVSRLRSVCQAQPPGPPPQGPGVETVLIPGQPPVTVCVPHKVGHWSVVTRHIMCNTGRLTRLGTVQQEAGRPVPGEDGEAEITVLESEGGLGDPGGGGETSPGQAGQRLQDDIPGKQDGDNTERNEQVIPADIFSDHSGDDSTHFRTGVTRTSSSVRSGPCAVSRAWLRTGWAPVTWRGSGRATTRCPSLRSCPPYTTSTGITPSLLLFIFISI